MVIVLFYFLTVVIGIYVGIDVVLCMNRGFENYDDILCVRYVLSLRDEEYDVFF